MLSLWTLVKHTHNFYRQMGGGGLQTQLGHVHKYHQYGYGSMFPAPTSLMEKVTS
jgi:hypothetical protein